MVPHLISKLSWLFILFFPSFIGGTFGIFVALPLALLNLMSEKKINLWLIKIVFPLFLLFLITLLSSNFLNYKDYFRVLFFSLLVILLLYIGYGFRRISPHFILKTLFSIGMVFSFYNIYYFVFYNEFYSLEKFDNIYRNPYAVFSLIILIYHRIFFESGLQLNKFLYYVFWFISLFSLLLSYSRSSWLFFIILFFFMGYRFLIKYIILVFLFFLLIVTEVDHFGILFKIVNSVNEVAIQNFDSMDTITLKWRGYENFLAISQYLKGNYLSYIFGNGFGSRIEIGFRMQLAGGDYYDLPIIHNGYLYVLFKYGLVGIFLYMYFFWNIFFSLHRNSPFDKLGRGILISLMYAMPVVMGMPQGHSGFFIVLLGYLLGITHDKNNLIRKRLI